MDRKDCFHYILLNDFKEMVKARFGKPYNSVSTEKLEEFIKSQEESKPAPINTIAYTRDTCFKIINKYHWKDEVKARYGKPYNSVSTTELQAFIATMKNKCDCDKEKEYPCTPTECIPTPVHKKVETGTNDVIDVKARLVLKGLCNMLNCKDLLKNLE